MTRTGVRRSARARGFLIVEALIAVSLLALLVTGFMASMLYGEEDSMLGGARSRAALLAGETEEALRNFRDNTFLNLVPTLATGLATSSNTWMFSGASDTTDIFTRVISIASSTSGTGIRLATTTITWVQNAQRTGSMTVETALTNWRGCRGGMLVYGDGGTTGDAIKYQILKSNDQNDCTWTAPAATADVDTSTTNKALRAVQLYASATRNEKVMISRHYDGLYQYIYAQVWNGDTGAWGNVQLLSSWFSITYLDVQQFSGTYLQNGDFMVVYADNTNTPKMRIWNGSTWSPQISLPTMDGIPTYAIARARPGTNEVMAAFFTQNKHTITQYFNGGAYATANWALYPDHGLSAPTNLERMIDFAWSPNDPLRGGLIFSDSNADKSMDIKIWTANGAGGGSWGGLVNSSHQSNNLGAMQIMARPGANEFDACDADSRIPSRLVCYSANFTPVWTNPANSILTTNGPSGVERSFGGAFESVSGNPAIMVYSDSTSVPKLKKYNAATGTWDSATTNLSSIGATLYTVSAIPYPGTDEVMVLMANLSDDLYSAVWDGNNTVMYTAPSGYALAAHGVNGSATTDYWYAFAWDAF